MKGIGKTSFFPDASSMLTGDNVLGKDVVHKHYVGILDRVRKQAVKKGQLTEQQNATGIAGAFIQPSGDLFLAVCTTDGSNLAVGTSVPHGAWKLRQ